MVHLLLRRNWIGRIRLALTLAGLPFTVCSSGVRPAISCTPSYPFRATKTITSTSTSCCKRYTTSVRTMPSSATLHVKSRCPQYPGSKIKRLPVPDDKVDWSQKWPQYNPVNHTDPAVLKKPVWADAEIGVFSPKFNTVDAGVDRTGFEGTYKVENGKPLWKVDAKGAKILHSVSKRPILQFVAIKRKDCGEWAIPGGMVDPGEQVSLTLQREFSEEALNSLSVVPAERAKIHERINKLFKSPGFQVYKGYVDDPRNTDNAWMETVAVNFHDESGNSVSELPLQAGDDAGQVKWVDVDSSFALYASHSHFLELVTKERKAHW
uniref:ADP-ribose pyrophosphatase, mitochondrial n=1 Tax=Amphiprion ocellaris TaxID=80972 RepID=A0AAQ5XHD6_AMPOC